MMHIFCSEEKKLFYRLSIMHSLNISCITVIMITLLDFREQGVYPHDIAERSL